MALDATIGGAAADTYATLAEYQAYGAAMGWALGDTDTDDEINLRRAAIVNDQSYQWLGYRVSATQARQWPRYVSGYVDGFTVPYDAIPAGVKNAQMEMAYLIQGGADPFAAAQGGTIISERKKVDVIETETKYSDGAGAVAYKGVDRMLAPYTTGKSGQRSASVTMLRA